VQERAAVTLLNLVTKVAKGTVKQRLRAGDSSDERLRAGDSSDDPTSYSLLEGDPTPYNLLTKDAEKSVMQEMCAGDSSDDPTQSGDEGRDDRRPHGVVRGGQPPRGWVPGHRDAPTVLQRDGARQCAAPLERTDDVGDAVPELGGRRCDVFWGCGMCVSQVTGPIWARGFTGTVQFQLGSRQICKNLAETLAFMGSKNACGWRVTV